jgi:hypothetical protein
MCLEKLACIFEKSDLTLSRTIECLLHVNPLALA